VIKNERIFCQTNETPQHQRECVPLFLCKKTDVECRGGASPFTKMAPKKVDPGTFQRPLWMKTKEEREEKVTDDVDGDQAIDKTMSVATIDPELASFLEDASTDDMSRAYAYLLRPPWRGRHDKLYKQSVKDAGLRWQKNPAFQEGGPYGGPPPGWFATTDHTSLLKVLTLPRKEGGERAWQPVDGDGLRDDEFDEDEARGVATLLDGFFEAMRVRRAAAREASAKRAAELEAARRARTETVGDDFASDVDGVYALMTAAGYDEWVYKAGELEHTTRMAHLGPRGSIAFRLHRALRIGVLTPAQLARGEFGGEADEGVGGQAEARARRKAAAEQAKRKREETQERLRALKARAEAVVAVLKPDDPDGDNGTRLDDAAPRTVDDLIAPPCLVANFAYTTTQSDAITCDVCDTEVSDQFWACMCREGWAPLATSARKPGRDQL